VRRKSMTTTRSIGTFFIDTTGHLHAHRPTLILRILYCATSGPAAAIVSVVEQRRLSTKSRTGRHGPGACACSAAVWRTDDENLGPTSNADKHEDAVCPGVKCDIVVCSRYPSNVNNPTADPVIKARSNWRYHIARRRAD
jgi:hypothetical protein